MVDGGPVTLVFDASALLAQTNDEPGVEQVDRLLADTARNRIVHAVNLCEVYYHFLKRDSWPSAEQALREWERAGLRTRDDIDALFWRDVARIKADVQRVSLGDCFAIALARRVQGTVITADHGEFDLVVARGICPVTFIR